MEQNQNHSIMWKTPTSFKIVTGNNILEQVSYFNYFNCNVNYDHGSNIEGKINKNHQIFGTLNRTLDTIT